MKVYFVYVVQLLDAFCFCERHKVIRCGFWRSHDCRCLLDIVFGRSDS
jgi:hypothetical protein